MMTIRISSAAVPVAVVPTPGGGRLAPADTLACLVAPVVVRPHHLAEHPDDVKEVG